MRAKARETAFKIIYQNLFSSENQYMCEELLSFDEIKTEESEAFTKELISLYDENKIELNQKLESFLVDYELSRVYKIDRAILLLAFTEILYYKKTDIAIVINEAVKMAKKFSTEKSYSFVNGVLKSLVG